MSFPDKDRESPEKSVAPDCGTGQAASEANDGDNGSFAPVGLVELLQYPACFLDGAGMVMHMNAPWRDYAGLQNADDAPTSWVQLICAEDRHVGLSLFRSAQMTGKRADFECRLQGADGTVRWFLLSLQPLNEAPEGKFRWLCIGTDIHELKLKKADLEGRTSIQTDMLNISVDCIKLIALDGTVVHMNKAGCLALGVPENSGFGMPWLPLLPQDVWVDGEKALAAAYAGSFARFAGRSILPGQKTQHWDNMLTPVIGPEGRPTAILCVSREVTAEREALESLRESEERLATAVRVGGLGIWDYDISHDVLRCDDAWYRIMGRDPAFPIQSMADFRPLIHPDDVDQATEVKNTAAGLLAGESDYAIVFRIIRPNGEIRWVRSAACLIQDMPGAAMRAVGFVVDITDAWRGELDLREANHVLEEEKISFARQSLEDPLTGIANRRRLDAELARICQHANETGAALCVGMVDVDHFKAYNDMYGHLKGDAALRQIASALQSVARQSDVVARYGGEEFAFLLLGITDPEALLTRFAATVADLAIEHAGSPSGYLTVSCGCVVFSSSVQASPELILQAGDEALYEAKRAGRNRHIIRAYRANEGLARITAPNHS